MESRKLQASSSFPKLSEEPKSACSDSKYGLQEYENESKPEDEVKLSRRSNNNDSYISSVGEDSSGVDSPRLSKSEAQKQSQTSIPQFQKINAKMQAPGSFQHF